MYKVIQPTTADEIAELLRSAQSKGTKVAVWGGRTWGQLLPDEETAPDILLDLSRMNRIRSIEKDNLLARVEAGVVTAAVRTAVAGEGLFYPPDPTSLETSTIGGNIACAAAGPHQLKYGGTRDFVMGLEVVLPSGERIRTGANTQKSVAGYDMTRFLIGSGARFGLVTSAILRLLPKPQYREIVLCAFLSSSAGVSAALAVMKNGMTPAAMELLDGRCLEVDRDAWASLGIARRSVGVAESLLLFELDGVEASVVGQRAQIERLCAQQGGAVVVTLSDPNTGTQALELRRRLLIRLMAAHPIWAMAKVAVAPEQFLAAWAPDTSPTVPCGQGSGCLCCFAHAGTGVLHLFAGTDPARGPEEDGALTRTRTVLRRLQGVGGTLLGIYGPARHALGEAEAIPSRLAEALTTIQRSFDPKGVMLP